MKKIVPKTIATVGAVSVLAGLFIGTFGLFFFPWLFPATGLAFMIVLLAVTTDRETGRNTRQPALLVFCGLLLSLVVAGRMIRRKESLQHREGDRMVSGLAQYRREKGHYPASLDSLFVKPQYIQPTYRVDSTGRQYQFEYWSLTSFNYYDSRTKEWVVND